MPFTLTKDMRPAILPFSGRFFNFPDPESSEFIGIDIAQGQTQKCRFAGHPTDYFAVAQRSVLASRVVSQDLAPLTLFHNAAEAFVGDTRTPLKRLVENFRQLEKRIERAIFVHLGLPETLTPAMRAGLVQPATEQRDATAPHAEGWDLLPGIDPLDERIVPVRPVEARGMFLSRVIALAGVEFVPQTMGSERREELG